MSRSVLATHASTFVTAPRLNSPCTKLRASVKDIATRNRQAPWTRVTVRTRSSPGSLRCDHSKTCARRGGKGSPCATSSANRMSTSSGSDATDRRLLPVTAAYPLSCGCPAASSDQCRTCSASRLPSGVLGELVFLVPVPRTAADDRNVSATVRSLDLEHTAAHSRPLWQDAHLSPSCRWWGARCRPVLSLVPTAKPDLSHIS